MDGNVQDIVARPAAERLSGPWTQPDEPAALGSDVAHVMGELLAVWDAVTVWGAGYLCALTYTAWHGGTILSAGAALHPGAAWNAGFLLAATKISVLGGILAPLVIRDRRAYVIPNLPPARDMVMRGSQGVVLLFCLLLGIGFLTRNLDTVPRLWAFCWIVSVFMLAAAGRLSFGLLVTVLTRRGTLCDRVAIIGDGGFATELFSHIGAFAGRGVRVVAVCDDVLAPGSQTSTTSFTRLLEMARRRLIDRVILATPSISNEKLYNRNARLFDVVEKLKALDIEVAYCPSLAGIRGASGRVSQVVGAPLVVLTSRPLGHWAILVKGLEDRVLALAALIVLAPLLAAIALAVRMSGPGPVIFRQQRHGWNGSEFLVLKFRTMIWAPPAANDPSMGYTGDVQTRRRDSRITRIGALLRRSSLDELPQLFNVLNGTMSLVGPRPHPVVMRTEARLGEEIVADYFKRNRVKPGITGWAQVNGYRGATETAEQVRKRVEHDIYYIDHWSFLFDMEILLKTPFALLFRSENAF